MALTDLEQAALATVSQDRMLAQTLAWSAVNCGSDNLAGLASIATLLAEAFATLPGALAFDSGTPVESIAADGSIVARPTGQHLILRVRPDAPLRFLFTGHMDTVYGADHPFQTLRWLNDDIVNGPGVADMKGGLAVMLGALEAVENGARAGGFTDAFGYDVLINSDEEIGSPSSAPLIVQLARGKLAALTYEPSALPDGTLAGARGGSGNFSIRCMGRSAHAGRNPDDGRNALVAAADIALRLKALHRPGLSVNPARIDGGSPNNVVPDMAILRVNFRPRSIADETEARAALQQICAAVAAAHDVDVHAHGSFGRPPKPIDGSAASLFAHVERCGADLGLSLARKDSGGVCDGNNIAATGVPVVDTMGARGGAIHSPDEYLIVSSLIERARLSALVVLRLIQAGEL